MLEEAIEIVRGLWRGESFTHRGCHYTVEDARIFDVPEELPPIVVSAFGDEAVELASRIGDGLWITGLEQDVIERYREMGGKGPGVEPARCAGIPTGRKQLTGPIESGPIPP